MSNITPIKWWWFGGTIGIVLVKQFDEVSLYIGKGHGYDEKEDVQTICDWGSKISPAQLDEILTEVDHVS